MISKRVKKLTIIIQILMMIFPTVFSVASTINIGDTLHIERGDLGFYTIQYWSETREKWMYITYSRTYYRSDNGERQIAYCMDPDRDGVGWLPGEDETYDTEVKYKLENEQLWRILKNGYPNASIESLGVETEDDAYLATKQAVYWVLKNKKLEDIYNHFRAGQTEINGQDLNEIKRRGQKVVDAIYKLVDIAYNQKEQTMAKPEVVSIGEFEQDENEKYYSKKYKITDSTLDSKINITSIENKPTGTFVADENGQENTSFKPGEIFKIMVPKENIWGDCIVKVCYNKEIESYPIYYTASKIEGKQNYIILLDKTEKEEGKVDFKVNGYRSSIKIIKTDEETGKPIEGVKFQISYDYGVKMGTPVTDKNGVAILKNLHQGRMIVKEIDTNEEYVLDDTEYKVNLEYNQAWILNIKNKHKKGTIEIEKVDKDDNNIHIDGVEFDLIDKDGNIAQHLITDENGKASASVNTGEYTLKEIKTKEEYKIGVEQDVKINWNEKLELKIENEKKKGKVKIVKRDKESGEALANVKFEILNDNEDVIETLITDEKGEAVSSDITIGTYYIKEIETDEKYILNDNKIEVLIRENQTKEIQIENERKKGQIKIVKTSADKNNALNAEAGSPIEGVKFAIYNNDNKLVEEISTNENGVAISSKLDIGKYTVQEIETGEWYILDNQKYNIEIKENEEIVELEVTNKSKDPKVEISKKCKNTIKSNDEIDYTFEIQNTGNTELEKLIWYDTLPKQYAKVTKIETGTYNQDVNYDIFYKTNQKDVYMVLKKNLNSKENNYIDLSNIHLEEGEKITEIKVSFNNVNVGFSNIEKPHIFMKVDDGVNNDEKIENNTILEGYILDYKVTDEDTASSIVYNVVEQKKLPRTGF